MKTAIKNPQSLTTFGRRLRSRRRELKIRVMAIAKEIGVSRFTFWRFEKGKAAPPWDKVELLAKILRVSPDYFIDWDKE